MSESLKMLSSELSYLLEDSKTQQKECLEVADSSNYHMALGQSMAYSYVLRLVKEYEEKARK